MKFSNFPRIILVIFAFLHPLGKSGKLKLAMDSQKKYQFYPKVRKLKDFLPKVRIIKDFLPKVREIMFTQKIKLVLCNY